MTINAAGVWTDEIQAHDRRQGPVPGAGVARACTCVVPRDRIDSDTGLITETEKSLLFIIPCPWSDDFWIIGTTDTPWNLHLAHPAASRADIDYILEHANALLAKPLTRDDVVGVYAGLRPLLAGESDRPASSPASTPASQPVPGLVDRRGRQVHHLPGDGEGRASTWPSTGSAGTCPECVTDKVPLVGAVGYEALVDTEGEPGRPLRPGRRADRAPARPVRLGDPGGPRPRRRTPRARQAAGARPALPRRSRRYYGGRRTKARCTWTTCWPAGCGCRSTPGTAASTWPGRSPGSSHRCWAGTPRRSSSEIEHYRPAGRGRARLAEPARRPDRRRRPARGAGGPRRALSELRPRTARSGSVQHARSRDQAATFGGGIPLGGLDGRRVRCPPVIRCRLTHEMRYCSGHAHERPDLPLRNARARAMLLLLGCGVVATAILPAARASAAAGCSSTSAGASASSPASTSRSPAART